jgi:hypothetical protein
MCILDAAPFTCSTLSDSILMGSLRLPSA